METEEDLLGGASPDLLYARSLELAAFRLAAADLSDRIAEASLMAARTAGPPAEFAHLYPDVLAKVSAGDLGALADVLLAPAAGRRPLPRHPDPRDRGGGAGDAAPARLAAMSEARFRDLLADEPERIDVVVRFLAILELHRQGKVELSQARAVRRNRGPLAGGSS